MAPFFLCLLLSFLLAGLLCLSVQVADLPFPAVFQHTSLAPEYVIFLESEAIWLARVPFISKRVAHNLKWFGTCLSFPCTSRSLFRRRSYSVFMVFDVLQAPCYNQETWLPFLYPMQTALILAQWT